MLVTEEEAKTKWCPEVRTGFEGDENRDREWDGSGTEPVPEHYACIGSKCMAWRWNDPAVQTVETALGQIPAGEGWKQDAVRGDYGGLRWSRPIIPRHGFCGKAGPTRM